jgi:hypothetical protein
LIVHDGVDGADAFGRRIEFVEVWNDFLFKRHGNGATANFESANSSDGTFEIISGEGFVDKVQIQSFIKIILKAGSEVTWPRRKRHAENSVLVNLHSWVITRIPRACSIARHLLIKVARRDVTRHKVCWLACMKNQKLATRALTFLIATTFTGSLLQARIVRADETIGDQAKDTSDQAKTETNKTTRKAKKTTRDATGNKNVAKDAAGQVGNAADESTDAVKKEGRKADDATN